jgi:hypothetical protein
MAYYNKIGLLILNDDATQFMVCEPGRAYGVNVNDPAARVVKQFLMPGGQIDEGMSDEDSLAGEIQEELSCQLDRDSLERIGEYTDRAATPGRDVMIRLYKGKVIGTPTPSTEIGALHWVGKEDLQNESLSPIIRNKIIPDLVEKNILR